MKSRKLIVAGVVTCLWVALMPQAGAVVALTQPGSTTSGYTTPVVLHRARTVLSYTNLDIDAHDIVSDASRPANDAAHCMFFPPGGCPLFHSQIIGTGETSSVYGTDLVDPGLYGFYCSLHPWMRGTLVVEG